MCCAEHGIRKRRKPAGITLHHRKPIGKPDAVNRTPSHRFFSRTLICAHAPHDSRCRSACLKKTCSSTCHHVSDRSLSLFVLTSSSLSSVSTFCSFSLSPLSWPSASMWSKPLSNITLAHTHNIAPRSKAPWRYTTQNESVDMDTDPSYSCDAEFYDELVGKALSGARRTSEPKTNLSLSWRKFVASSVLFHTYKYVETRVRTKFRFVSKPEIQSRPGKRANQDSP